MMKQVASPCIGICRIERTNGWCVGCGRTSIEIESWPRAGEKVKALITSRLPERMTQLSRRRSR